MAEIKLRSSHGQTKHAGHGPLQPRLPKHSCLQTGPRGPRGGPERPLRVISPLSLALSICNTLGHSSIAFWQLEMTTSVHRSVRVAIYWCPRPHGCQWPSGCSSHMATLIDIATLVPSWPLHGSSIKPSGSYALSPRQRECCQIAHRLARLISNIPNFLNAMSCLRVVP